MERRVTQNEVAIRAGVHPSTVSLVFKNHPGIPEATRERIKRIAAEMGYAPDPMLSALAAYSARRKPHAFQGTLAWMTNNLGRFRWNGNIAFRKYFQGAQSRAETYGFKLEEFDLQTPNMTADRLRSIFRSRNIQGLLLCPQPLPGMEVDFHWEDFSAVAFGHTLVRPRMHTVTCAHYRTMVQTMRRLKEMGYRRIGFVFSKEYDHRVAHSYLAGYLVELFVEPCLPLIPFFYEEGGSPETLRKWAATHRPDAIVCGNSGILRILAEAGLKVPDDVGVANFILHSNDGAMAGILENSFHMGEVATDVVVRMIQCGERGIPAVPQHIEIEGVWSPGRTLPDRTNPSPKRNARRR